MAQNRLGDVYRFGEGVEQSYEEAVKWYQKAAEQWSVGDERGEWAPHSTDQGFLRFLLATMARVWSRIMKMS